MLFCRNIWRILLPDRTLHWVMLVDSYFVTSFIDIDTFWPASGDPVTGRTTSVQHEILTPDARLVRCGPRRLPPSGLRTEQKCVQDMLLGGQIEPSDSLSASPVVLVSKKDGSTRFCVDYRRLNALTTKNAYPLPWIDNSLRLLGNQQWFYTMDLASGYWQVAMSPDTKRQGSLCDK